MRCSGGTAPFGRKTRRSPSGGSASWTRGGKSLSFVTRTTSLLRRVIPPNPPPLRASPAAQAGFLLPVGQACPCIGLTQPATVIFWTADLFVTASARIVLVMIQGALWSWQVLTRRWVAPRRVVASPGRRYPNLGGRAHRCHSEIAMLRIARVG